ncbi:hypothetical protein Pyn_15066 [Prunus yedoensis var. nudiflora]|uniref:Uncharacterized protein n=1 Tax=Prunus yedoensis var. nudiflora TaxID=2094558 RepID=A0A314ZTD8_PRUYE|nr:hypothetical protein Pyn_15066 [Prunus yedoensis var. nudiflora]
MNPSHVVYGAYTRDCGVEGYGGPQDPRKLLNNEDFGLATWEHQSPSPLLRVLQCGERSPSINWEALPKQNQHLLVAASLLATMRTHFFLATASIPAAINPFLQPSTLPLVAGATQQLFTLAAASIPVAINPLLQPSVLPLAAGAAQQLLLWLLQASQQSSTPFNYHTYFLVVASTPAITSSP